MRTAAAVLVLSIFAFPAIGAEIEVVGPGGIKISCASLTEFEHGDFDASDMVFNLPRSNWSGRSAAFVSAASQKCFSKLQYDLMRSGRLTTLAQDDLIKRQKRVDAKAALIANQNKYAEDMVAEQDKRYYEEIKIHEQEIKAREAEDAKQVAAVATQACNSTRQHQLFAAQEDVIEFQKQLSEWRQKQQYEARIVRVAGVRDLYAERANGEWVVQLTDNVKDAFAEYRRQGGKASSPGKVTHLVIDPCGAHKE